MGVEKRRSLIIYIFIIIVLSLVDLLILNKYSVTLMYVFT